MARTTGQLDTRNRLRWITPVSSYTHFSLLPRICETRSLKKKKGDTHSAYIHSLINREEKGRWTWGPVSPWKHLNKKKRVGEHQWARCYGQRRKSFLLFKKEISVRIVGSSAMFDVKSEIKVLSSFSSTREWNCCVGRRGLYSFATIFDGSFCSTFSSPHPHNLHQ